MAARGLAATNLFGGEAVWGIPGNSTGSVLALALSADGSRLVAGGDFSYFGGTVRSRLAAVDPRTGAIDPAFNPGADGPVRALVTAPDGRIFAGGDFTRLAGRAQPRLAALAGAGGAADPTWQVGADGRVERAGPVGRRRPPVRGRRLRLGRRRRPPAAGRRGGGRGRRRRARLGPRLPRSRSGRWRCRPTGPASTPAAGTTTRTRR